MIHGIGSDVLSVRRVERDWDRLGDRLALRILHADEWPDYQSCRFKARYLARRFAAKEAVAKALGTGFRHGVSARRIAVGHDDLWRPIPRLHGAAAEYADSRGIGRIWLSISDERDYAVAFAVAWCTTVRA